MLLCCFKAIVDMRDSVMNILESWDASNLFQGRWAQFLKGMMWRKRDAFRLHKKDKQDSSETRSMMKLVNWTLIIIVICLTTNL